MKQAVKKEQTFWPAVAVLAGLLLVVVAIFSLPVAEAAPVAVPTPVISPAGESPTNVTFWASEVITEDGGSNSIQIPEKNVLDVQYVIDQGDINTVTLRLEFSNDPLCVVGTGSTAEWSTGVNLVASNAADADEMLQAYNFGRCTRLYADVDGSNTVTVTARAVAK